MMPLILIDDLKRNTWFK